MSIDAKRWVVLLVAASGMLGVVHAADWPAFRGSHGGFAADKDLPVQWTQDNVLWKVKLPGLGASSPIVVGDKLFVTCYSGYGTTISKGFGKGGFGKGGFGKGPPGKGAPGKGETGKGAFGKDQPEAGDQSKLRLHVLCVERQTGKTVWQKDLQPSLPESAWSNFNREHGYASSTPASDGESIFAFFGKSGVFAFDLAGQQLWQAHVGAKTDVWGSAASPVLYKNLVIVNAAIESGAMIALDKKTGKEVWRIKGISKNWTSPIIVPVAQAKADSAVPHELVISLPGSVVGYNPADGQELWRCQGIGSAGAGYTISTPVTRDGIVYVIGGGGPSGQATALAIRAGGRGDVTQSHQLWRQKGGSSVCSPVLVGDHLCWVAGSATCLNAADGKMAYQEDVYSGRSEYVSAVAAGDRIFALTRFNGLYVLAAGGKFEQLAHNEFKGDASVFNASPAISDGRLYIRSNEYLYCIGK